MSSASEKKEYVPVGSYPSENVKARMSAELITFIEKIEQDTLDLKIKETYEALKSPPNAEWSEDPEIQWRLARACARLAASVEKLSDEFKAYVDEGLAVMRLAEKKVPVDDNKSKFMVNFLMSGLVGYKTEFMTTEERVANASAVKDYAQKAHEADEEAAGPLHIIGMWCLRVAQLGVAARAGAAIVYDSLPESSFEEALTNLSKSLRKDSVGSPTYALNLLAIGQCLTLMEDKDGAETWFKKLIDLKTDLPNYHEVQRQAKEELKKVKKSKSWW